MAPINVAVPTQVGGNEQKGKRKRPLDEDTPTPKKVRILPNRMAILILTHVRL